jgi:mannan endo-1,4-beta-mannosidase
MSVARLGRRRASTSGPRTARRRVRPMLIALAALVAIVALDAGGGATSRAATAPAMSISPASGPSGARVTVTGSGFQPRTSLQLQWDGSAAGMPALSVPGSGKIGARFRAPRSARAGSHEVAATSTSGAVLARTAYTVLSSAATSSPSTTPAVTASPRPTPTPTAASTPSTTATPAATSTTTPSPTGSPSGHAQFVTRCGAGVCVAGQPYTFTGLNVYNANSRADCWYTLGAGTALDASLDAIGPGQEAFRAWFFQRQATVSGQRDWAAFDHTLAEAAAHGQRVIATLTNQWGDCENVSGSPVYKAEAWYQSGYRSTVDPGMTATYRDWVREVVTRYRDDPTILAWQLVNEGEALTAPGGSCSSTAEASVEAWTRDIAGVVKSIDPNHLLSLGTIGNGQCGTSTGTSYQDLHAIGGIDLCEYHDYDSPAAWPGDQWNGLATRLAQCTALGKPMFVGETGIRSGDAGSLQLRATEVDAKWSAQIAGGIIGELAWAWAAAGQSTGDGYSISLGDPLLGVLANH